MRPLFPLLALSSLLALACTHSQAPSAPAAPPAPAEPPATARLLPPLQLSWEQRSLTATEAVLVAHVKRLAALPMPVLLRLEVPAGATLVSGRRERVLEPNSEPGEVTETVTLSFAAVPATDLVLLADAESKAAGFHFSATYRFGREEPPPPPAAQPAGPALKKGDRALGPSVPLDQVR